MCSWNHNFLTEKRQLKETLMIRHEPYRILMHTLEAPLQYVINLTRSNLQKMEASGRVTKKNYKNVMVALVMLRATFISTKKLYIFC